MKKLKTLLLASIVLLLVGCNLSTSTSSISDTLSKTGDKITIHYIDVGQGDATFIELPNHETMLIDAGEKEYGETVKKYIQNLQYKQIDYLLGTHPHSDHIGGLEEIVDTFDIGKVYMPKAVSTSKTYTSLLKAIQAKKLSIQTAKAGVNILKTEDCSIDLLAPNQDEYASLNNYSIVLKIKYKDRSFLFTGDAETLSEKEILDAGLDVQSDVIKIAHHGSDTSSSTDFVNHVRASYGIISVGKGNIYDHPSSSIIKRWEDSGTKLYRTDEVGTIVLKSDGEAIEINDTEAPVEQDSSSLPSPEESPSLISLLNITQPIKRGEQATVEIQGQPNTNYDIQVFYKSGESSASGLEDKVSDSEGKVSWTWKVAPNVTPGIYKIFVKDNQNTFTIEYEIKE